MGEGMIGQASSDAFVGFRDLADMSRRIARNLSRVPEFIDCVVAVPRSGEVPAAFLGLQIGRPVLGIDCFIALGKDQWEHILLVDDICRTGATVASARERIAAQFPEVRVTTLVVYCHASAACSVDIAFEQTESELLLEWSLFRSPMMARACLDMDGILCGDARPEQDDDGVQYREFLANTGRHVVPRGRVHRIVTSRLEKYRAETESWLARHEIEYSFLTMLDLPTLADRRRLRPQAGFKADVFRSDPNAMLFIESESWQARAIARLVPGKVVFDYRTRTLLDSENLRQESLKYKVKKALVSRARRLMGKVGT